MINVLLLALCQALLLVNAVTLVAVGALAGYALADNKVFATLPATVYVIGSALSTFPASLYMKRVGRRAGFLTGAAFGLAGSVITTVAIATGSFATLCAGTFLFGIYNAFGQYYRFAAADAAEPSFKAKAISYVLAGGLVGGIFGPEISKHTRGLFETPYLGSYASLFVYALVAMAIVSRLRIPQAPAEAVTRAGRPLLQVIAQPVFLVAAGNRPTWLPTPRSSSSASRRWRRSRSCAFRCRRRNASAGKHVRSRRSRGSRRSSSPSRSPHSVTAP